MASPNPLLSSNVRCSMVNLAQYKVVRVVSASHPASEYDGWCFNHRSPRPGDVGTIVDILSGDQPTLYVVECVDESGNTVWLSEFTAAEIAVA